MSGARRLLLDDGPGERRGVVFLDGQPERLLIERDGEPAGLEPGLRAVARVRRLDRGLGLAFLDLGEAGEAVLSSPSGVAEGQALEVEVLAPARRGKQAVVRSLGPADGPPRVTRPTPVMIEQLQALALDHPIERGETAEHAADAAEDAALAVEHVLPGGGRLSIETTRALTAIDIDVGAAAGGDRRRTLDKVNRTALAAGARLLRLKGLGGLVVFDLAGRGGGGEVLLQAAREAFGGDMPGVAFGPVSRLGVFHLALPWRARPVAERLLDPDGRSAPRAVAQRLGRVVEREARCAVRVRALCASEVAAVADPVRAALVARLGPRIDIEADPSLARDEFVVRAV